MNLLEHQGKQLLARAEIRSPRGSLVRSADEAAEVAATLGRKVVLKSQVPSGKRGKAGGIAFAEGPDQAKQEAERLLGSYIAGYPVTELLVEQGIDIAHELYLAVLNDPASKGPLVLFSSAGGADIEEINAAAPNKVRSTKVDVLRGLSVTQARELVDGHGFAPSTVGELVNLVFRIYELYREVDAELVEVNPLVITTSGVLLALDSKISLDPGARARHPELVERFGDGPARGTELERRARELGLQFIELDGDVGILANGAGLTMTTLDAVHHYGGKPANFLEIGGDAYTKAVSALRLALDNPRVRSLLVNFCGAFARTDVMTGGVVEAIKELRPEIPVFFSVHGTGEAEAVALLRDELGVEPYENMDDAVRAAVTAAGTAREAARQGTVG
ncbi:MAG: succinate--CoA ligase [Pseudonocardiaceae bacterium]|nr:succinate--CoA ligase [Pseudonocardiaceae bacterium]